MLHTVCMDLIGPIGGEVSSGKAPHAPRHILVTTDPYSHMVWLENLYTKSAEELYEKFVSRFLLEEGCPRVILTDNGREFDNKLLRESDEVVSDQVAFHTSLSPKGELHGKG